MFDPFSDSPAPSRSPSPSPWGFNPFLDPTPGIAPAPEPASFAPDPLDDEIAALRAQIAARGTATKGGAKEGNFFKDAPAALIQGGANVLEGFDTLISDFTPLGYGFRKLSGKDLKPFETLSNVGGAAAAGLAGYGDGIDPFFNEQGMQREAGSDFMSRQKSDALLELQSQRAQNVADAGSGADGWIGREASKGWAFLKDTFSSPRMMADLVITQIPLMLPSLGAAKLARGLVPVVDRAAMTAAEIAKIEKVSTWASRLAGAAMQGADVSGDTKKDLSNLLASIDEKEARQIPALAEMLSEGMDLEDAKAEYALGHAQIAGVLGGLASVISNSIPGIGGGVEDALARIANRGATKVAGKAAGSVLLEALKGAGKEVPSELLEEGLGKLAGNYEAKKIDPTRELSSGQGETLAAAAAGAIGTGGFTGAIEGFGDQGVSNPPPAPVPNAAATAARRAAMTGQPATATAKAKPTSQFTPTARAAMLAQQNPQAAAKRLAELSANQKPSADEIVERDVLAKLVAPPTSAASPSQVPTSGATAAPPVTPSVQKPVDVGSTPPPATTPAPAPAPVPLVKPTTAGELRLRVKKANAMLERINRDVPGMKTSAALDKLRTDIAAGTVDDKTVAALEKEVADHEASSVAVAQQRALESERQQNERARIAAETKRAAQEKKNAAAVEKLADAIKREQAKAFKKDPQATIAELQAERDSTLAAGADARDIEARIAEFTAKLPAPKPLKSAEAIASDIMAELAAPAPVVPATPVDSPLPQPAAVPLAFGKASFAGPDALGGFNFEGLANGLNQAKQEGKLTPEVVSSLGAQLEAAVTKQVEQSTANKEGGIFGPDGNTSDTRTALAFQMPDGSVVLAGLLAPKNLTSIDGSGRKENGLRVVRMASRGGSGEGKQIKVNGSSPVLLSDLLSAGIFPIDAVRFDEAPGKPLQKFQNRDEYNASIAALNLTQKSAPMVGGDNENSSGGATTVNADGDTQNLDAADAAQQRMAEAEQQTAPKETLAHSQAATEWGVGSDDQVVRLWNKLVDSGGKMSDVRTKKLKSLLGWLDEATMGIDNADLALERIFENSPTVEAFAENGRDPANWIAKVTDSTQAPAPAAIAPETKPLAIDATPAPAALPAATTPETVGLTPASIEQVWKRVNDTGDAAMTLAKMQASNSAKVKAIAQEFTDANIGPQEVTDALAVAKKAKAEKKTSKADTRTLAQRLEAAQVATFVKVLRGEGQARVDGGDTLSGNEPLKTGTGAGLPGSPGLQSGAGQNPGSYAENARRNGTSAPRVAGGQVNRVLSESALLPTSGLPEIKFPSNANAHGVEHIVVGLGKDARVLKFTSPHANIPHGLKLVQSFTDGGPNNLTTDFDGARQPGWKKNGFMPGAATVTEYADRWNLFNQVFGGDVRIEGWARRPDGTAGLVISQPHILGTPSTWKEIATYLTSLGFETARNPFGAEGQTWVRFSDDVVIGDVKPDNFRTDRNKQIHAIDVLVSMRADLRVPGADTTPAQQAERTGDTQRIIERLRPFVNVTRVARIIGNENAAGKSISPDQVVIAMEDVAFNSNRGLVTLIHEAAHSLFSGLPDSKQASIRRAVQRSLDSYRARAESASKKTGVNVASNTVASREFIAKHTAAQVERVNVDEALVEATAQEFAAEGLAEPQGMAAALWRMVKDIYLTAARALLDGVGARQEVIDQYALAWWENSMRRKLGGDFEWAFINVMDRWLPTSSTDRAAALENTNGTPGGLADFIDPLTGEMVQPDEAAFREADPELDLDRQTAWDRIEGASLNEVIPMLDEAKQAAARDMDEKKWWALIGKGDMPAKMVSTIENRTPGASSATLNGDGMNTAMNQRAAERALRRVRLLATIITSRIAKRTDAINRASADLLKQSEKTTKIEAEYKDASVLEGHLGDKLRGMIRQMARAIDKGMSLSTEAGKLAEAIAEAEGSMDSAIPDDYQAVFKSILDGTTPVFDYMSAISKLNLDLRSMSARQTHDAIRAAAPSDARLASLVANRPLMVALTALARNSAREMALLQLRQLSNQTEAAAIKKELEQIRTASREQLDAMWETANGMADQSSLAAVLRHEYLKERRVLRRMERTIANSAKEMATLETVQDFVQRKRDDLDKAVGNFSAWNAVKGAVWTAMRQGAKGWEAVERTLDFDAQDRMADVARVRDDLAANKAWLEQNPDLAGTAPYEQVKRQTYEIAKLNMERTGLAAQRWWLVDALFPDLGTKLAGTGTAGGDQLRAQMRRFSEIVKTSEVQLNPLSHRWSSAFKQLFAEAGGFKDYNEFFKAVIVPTIYKIESETGKDETAALREARAYARARVASPTAKFDARLEEFLRRTKEVSEFMVKTAQANGVHIEDPRLGGQLRKAIGYGWMTVPRSLDLGVVNTLKGLMEKAGWSVEYAVTEKTDSSKQTTQVKRVLKGSTFTGMDVSAADLGAKLQEKFTADVVDRWLEPFIRKPGKPVFYTPDGAGIDSLAVENAWAEAGGDVLGWIDGLGESTGALELFARENKGKPTAPNPVEAWRSYMLGRLDSLWAMEMRLAHSASVVSKPFDSHSPKAHTLMDARLNDDIPPEHLTYAYFDPVQSSNRLAELAYHAAFGRNGDAANAALLSAHSEIQQRAALHDSIWDQHTSKKAREEAAKAAGLDYNTLARAPKDKRRLREWERALNSLFSPGGRSGVVDDISAGQEMLRLQQILILNQPTSGLWNLLSATDFPVVFRGAGKTARAAMTRAVKQIFTEGFGSLLQDFGMTLQRGSAYAADIGQMIDGRRLNSLEWGVRTSDIGNRGEYADAPEGLIDLLSQKTKQVTRKVTSALDKGLTPGDVLRGGRANEGGFGRFNLLTSPFKFLNDTVAKAIAVSNVQTYESIVKRGLEYAADNPGALNDPAFKFTAADLGMDSTGILGDKGAFDFYRTKGVEYGVGTLEDLVRSAGARKLGGQTLLTREQAMSLAMMALNEVALESSINNRPVEMFTNPAIRLGTPLMGWPIAKMNQVNQMLKTPEGQFAWKAVMQGIGVMALIALPMGVAFSLGMDEWDERMRGKKSQLPEIGMDKTTRQNAVGVLARAAKAGNVYGLGADVAFSALVAPLDPASGQRQFTLDSRVLAYSQMKSMADALKAIPMQDWQMTWAGGARQIMMAMGGNGPIQYVQMLNQMGFGVSDAEARVLARQNVYASIRQAAVNSGIAVKANGGAVTPTAEGLWLREMQMAAFSGERLAFRDAYLKALQVERDAGEEDPVAKVRDAWGRRSPFRVLDNPRPSPAEMAKIYGAMDDGGRRLVQDAIRNYETFTAFIEPSPMDKALAKAKRTIDPAARMAARRKAMGQAPTPPA